jgi:riboflavin synthase
MFTGIIEEVGFVTRRSAANLSIRARLLLDSLSPGDSVAVDGACLTVVAADDQGFVVQTSPETLARSTLSLLRVGNPVNLERAVRADGRLGGHFVLGHVDGMGSLLSVQLQGEFSRWRFQAPPEVSRYLIPKGSIAVDGISLTIVDPESDAFEVAIIPTTLERTALGRKRPGDRVNLEADMIGKHIYHYLAGISERGSLTLDFLRRHGFA